MNRVLHFLPVNVIITFHALLGFTLVGTYILIEAAITGDGFRFAEYSGRSYGILLSAVLCDSLCLFMATIAFQNDSGGFVGLLLYMSIVYAYFCDQFLFD